MAKKKQVTAVVPASNYKTRVSDQYRTVCEKTGEFFREVVKFGALLNEVADFIGESRGGAHDDDGLKGWLAENCPEVNYNTAQGYKAMAAKCARMIGGGSQAIAALQGQVLVVAPGTGETIDVDGDFIRKRDELFGEARSRRQLEQMWFEFCGGRGEKSKGGRPKAEEKPLPKLKKSDEAKSIWNVLLQQVTKTSVKDAIPLLPEKESQIAYDTVRDLADMLKKHLGEF